MQPGARCGGWASAPASSRSPTACSGSTGQAELEFVDISAPMAAFSLERDLGLMVVGRLLAGPAQVQAGRRSTAPAPTVPNDNFDLAYAAAHRRHAVRAAARRRRGHRRARAPAALGRRGRLLQPGADRRRRAQGIPNAPAPTSTATAAIDNVAVWQGGVELRALWRGAALQAELFGRLEDPGGGRPVAQLLGRLRRRRSYFVLPHRLQVAARVGHTDLPLYGATAEQRAAGGRPHRTSRARRVTAYLRGHRVKVQVDYSHLHRATGRRGRAPTAHRVRAAIQLGFYDGYR